uniref:Si:ch211-132e22.4 n=1 Tax=Cyclopterus lumpus TaxID=8103 RepID=A0A8C2XCB5_CYCLU
MSFSPLIMGLLLIIIASNKIPMHVMFLLASSSVPVWTRSRPLGQCSPPTPPDIIFYFGVVANVTLMLFIAQERHLLVAYPHCLGRCGSVSTTSGLPVSLLAPFPFLLFFAVDSWRALICSRSNPTTPERRRAVWGIGAIWANYTLLYVPFIVSVLLEALFFKDTVTYLGLVSHLLLYLSPLVDPFLYIFMTNGFREMLQALPCCRKQSRGENMASINGSYGRIIFLH